MKQFKALIGEMLIHLGMTLANPAWSDFTMIKFGEFVRALKVDVNAR